MENRATGTTTGDMLNNTKVCTDQYQPPIFVEKMVLMTILLTMIWNCIYIHLNFALYNPL